MCHDRIDRTAERGELSEEELEAQRGETLPDREVMSVIAPEVGRFTDMPLPADDDSTVEPYPRDPLPIQ